MAKARIPRRLKQFGLLTIDILEVVFKVSSILIQSITDQKELKRQLKYGDYDDHNFSVQLKRLIRTGYLEELENDGQHSIRLTKKGRLKLLENMVDKTLDGKWRMLSFDVPEKMRSQRDAFRKSIKRIGFRQVQKSLWACPYTHAEEVELSITEHKVDKYVAYMVVERTDIEPHLKRLFSNEWGELE